jgi:hypothetical protein
MCFMIAGVLLLAVVVAPRAIGLFQRWLRGEVTLLKMLSVWFAYGAVLGVLAWLSTVIALNGKPLTVQPNLEGMIITGICACGLLAPLCLFVDAYLTADGNPDHAGELPSRMDED